MLTGGAVEINDAKGIPWRVKHPQVCLHLAYILPVADFPSAGFSPAPCCRILLPASLGDPESVPQRCSSHVITGTSIHPQRGRKQRCCKDAMKTLHHHAAHAPRSQEVEASEMRCKDTYTHLVPSLKAERSPIHGGLMERHCRLHERESNLLKRHVWRLTM